MTFYDNIIAIERKANPPVRDQLKYIHACHPCCSFTSIMRPILAALTIVFFVLFAVMPDLIGFAVVGGLAAGSLFYTIIFSSFFGASVGCKYIWCACFFKQSELLEQLPKMMSRNQLKTIAVEDIQDIETRKQATFRLWKIKCYNCCNITSVLKIASLIVVPALFPIAFCVPGINEALKWTLVGLASLAGAFLFYASVFSLALSPMFGCDMKYSCCTFCQPKDTAFDSDF